MLYPAEKFERFGLGRVNWRAEAELWQRNAEHLGDKYQAVCEALGIEKNSLRHVAVERAKECKDAYKALHGKPSMDRW
jgi:hypothetical protein